MKKVRAYDANEKVIFSTIALNDDEVDMLIEYIFALDNVARIEVR